MKCNGVYDKHCQQTRNRDKFPQLLNEHLTKNLLDSVMKTVCFPPKIGNRQRCPLSLFLFNAVLDDLARAMTRKGNKRYTN